MIIREETASTKWQVWRYQSTNEDFTALEQLSGCSEMIASANFSALLSQKYSGTHSSLKKLRR